MLMLRHFNRRPGRRAAWIATAMLATGAAFHSAAAAAVEQVTFQHIVVDQNNPRHPHAKGVGDIDGDGRIDLLAASASGGGVWWYAYPDWSKHQIATGSFTTDMAVGDVTGNGHMDVVIPSNQGLMLYRNPAGDGDDPRQGPWPAHNIGAAGAQMHDVVLVDLTGDGRLDVVTRHQSGFGQQRGNEIHLWVQQDPQNWVHRRIPTMHGEGVAVADLTGSGRPDIIIGGRWYEHPGDALGGAWQEHHYINAQVFSQGWTNGDTAVTVADINGNGRLDIALSPAEGSGRLSWFEAPEDPTAGPWQEHVILNQTDHMHALVAADMNGDGQVDLVTAKMHQATAPREVAIFYNAGGGADWVRQVLSTQGSHNVQVFPYGDTGRLAIFGANWNDSSPTGGALELWAPVDEVGLLPGDANRDGRVDGEDFLIWQAHFGIQIGATWEMGNFNGDGRVDGEDFLIWQAHFGSVGGSTGVTPVATVTPEPGVLSLLALVVWPLGRRRMLRSDPPRGTT